MTDRNENRKAQLSGECSSYATYVGETLQKLDARTRYIAQHNSVIIFLLFRFKVELMKFIIIIINDSYEMHTSCQKSQCCRQSLTRSDADTHIRVHLLDVQVHHGKNRSE